MAKRTESTVVLAMAGLGVIGLQLFRWGNAHQAARHFCQETEAHRAVLVQASRRGIGPRTAQLEGAFLAPTPLKGTSLRGVDLHGADLHGADLWSADLTRANLQGANLAQANL